MKKIFITILLFGCLNSFAQQRFYPQALIELYSSEGCENCPFADLFIKQIMDIADSIRQPVYAIDFHVDIWDRSGWKDPYSDPQNTKRQMQGAAINKQPAIFTPMVFINGEGAVPGGAGKEIGDMLNTALATPRTHRIQSNAKLIDGKSFLSIDYQVMGKTDSIEIHFALIKKVVKQNVTAGDNKGKVLEHHNVVIKFETIDLVQLSGHYELSLPNSYIDLREYGLVSFLQKKGGGKVFAVDELLFR